MGVSFNYVTPRLATGGGIETREDVLTLIASGITDILDVRSEKDDAALLPVGGLTPERGSSEFRGTPGIGYLWNPTEDDGQPKPPEWFQRTLEWALPVLAKPKRRIYAHCAAGVNRGPSSAYAIMRAFGLSPIMAHVLVVEARPEARIRYANDADAAVRTLGYV